MVFYYYRIDKNEFNFKNKEIVLGNGSSYLIELIPKDSRYFDHKNYVYKIENSNIATVYNAYRQGICQVNNNNFIVVSSKSGKTKSTKAFGELLKSLGCKTAFNLDGGGSHAMLYKPSNTSSVKILTGNERSLSTVMYFTELN